MAKDPAFLFYSNDFISGTQFFTNEEVGIYIRLLCAQHQHGRLSEKQVLFICNTIDNEVLKKFTKDENGMYYNERLEIEILRRKSFSESRAKNRLGKTKNPDKPIKKPKKNKSLSYVQHMETENGTETEKSKLEITVQNYIEMRNKIKKPITDEGLKLMYAHLEKLAPNNKELQIKMLEQSIFNSWQGIFPLKTDRQTEIQTGKPSGYLPENINYDK